jgi:uncharacterized protein DUF268
MNQPDNQRKAGLGRRLARAILWPISRFFDPRFQGIAAQMSATHTDLSERIDAATGGQTVREVGDQLAQLVGSVDEVDRVLRAEIETATDATTLTGEALAEVNRAGSETLALVRELHQTGRDGAAAYVAQLVGASVEDLEGSVVDLLNYAESHQGFAAQRNLWFNPPVSLTYTSGDVAVAHVNERVVEIPYVLRALAAVPVGGTILDVGATESLLSFWLASLGYDVTALDPRPYPLSHPRLEVAEAEIQRWQPIKTFDAVVCLSTLEHIGLGAYGEGKGDDGADVAAMGRMRDCTAVGGVLVLTTPYGKATSDEFARVYDRAALEGLLDGWEVSDLTIARRHDTDWVVDSDAPADETVESVALVTARRPGG